MPGFLTTILAAVPELPTDKLPDLTLNKFKFFLVLVVPGLVAIKVYDLFLPRRRNLANALIEAILYSLVNLAVFHWALIPINLGDFAEKNLTSYILLMIGLVGIAPAILAVLTYKLRTSPFAYSTLGIDHPHRTAWEHFVLKRKRCFMIFHLKNGDFFGGYYGPDSYATTYPHEPEVYVEKVYEVGPEGFVKEIEGTFGSVVRLADIERIEFLEDTAASMPTPMRWWKQIWPWLGQQWIQRCWPWLLQQGRRHRVLPPAAPVKTTVAPTHPTPIPAATTPAPGPASTSVSSNSQVK